MIGWDDTPHLLPPNVDKETLDELEADMLPHQRQARRTGRPSLGAGAVYPVEEDRFLCEPFPIPEFWPRAYSLDVGWNRTAALFGARDPDTEIEYWIAEYYVGQAEPVIHAHAIQAMMPKEWELEGAIDPASRGSSQRDGRKLRYEYEDLGLKLRMANNAKHAGIHNILVGLQTGQIRVFNTLVYWLKEFRLYRRDEKGKIIDENDHLMDCSRYLRMTDGVYMTRPQQRARRGKRGEW